MKVYVSKRPNSCKECQFCDKDNGLCEMLGQYFRDGYDYTDCPLQSLADYTKQVRKEVYQELKNKILYCPERIFEDGHYYNGKELDEILDQIQGEQNEETKQL